MTNNGFDYGLAIHLDTYLPTLAEIKGWSQGDDEQAQYFKQFGWNQLEVFPDCPHVQARMPDLQLLFEEKYAFRQSRDDGAVASFLADKIRFILQKNGICL